METERILLRHWQESDAEALFKYASDPDVGPRAGWPAHKSVEESRRTRQTLWSAVQMLTQKLCCQTIHDCPKVVPLHYESE